jgi:predicted glycosyltransferase
VAPHRAERRRNLNAEVLRADPSGFGRQLRFFMYSHDGVGLGHLRRNVAISEALSELAPDCPILLASGVSHVGQFPSGSNIDFLKLPELRKVENQQYASRRLGLANDDILDLRANILRASVESFQPDVLLVDKHPIGAGGELLSALESVRNNGGRAMLGLRDILDDPVSVHQEWLETNLMAQVSRLYDEVLVYGQPEIFDPVEKYGFCTAVAERVRFCGYVVNQGSGNLASDSGLARLLKEPRTRPLVLATMGGGEDGFRILQTFIHATSGMPWQGVAVAGPMMPAEQMKTLQRAATEAGVFFEPFIAGLESVIGSFDALVCMGGYNTLLEGALASVPTLCVPRMTPRREQEMRAQRFQELGLLRMIQPGELEVSRMRQDLTRLLESRRGENVQRIKSTLRFNGAEVAARRVLEMALDVRRRPEEFCLRCAETAAETWAGHVN